MLPVRRPCPIIVSWQRGSTSKLSSVAAALHYCCFFGKKLKLGLLGLSDWTPAGTAGRTGSMSDHGMDSDAEQDWDALDEDSDSAVEVGAHGAGEGSDSDSDADMEEQPQARVSFPYIAELTLAVSLMLDTSCLAV